MSLFNLDDFTLHSGAKSNWKIDCDALSTGDIEALAEMIRQLVGPFREVRGIPCGGLRLEDALKVHRVRHGTIQTVRPADLLLVDDVLTTGDSMERAREAALADGFRDIVGSVLFVRGPRPPWVQPLFQMPRGLWTE